MVITGIVKKRKLVEISFDDDSHIFLNYMTVLKNGLRINDELSEEFKEKLIADNEYFTLKETAVNLLSRRLHSESELRIKLKNKKYHNELIENVIEDLRNNKLLNDEFFAEKYVEEKLFSKRSGFYKVKSDLIKKGIDREILSDIFNKYQDNPIHLENALKLAHRRLDYLSIKKLDKKQLNQKIFSHLRSKGFQINVIYEVLGVLELS